MPPIGPAAQPLAVVIEAAEALRPQALAPVLTAARHATRPVILRVIRPSER